MNGAVECTWLWAIDLSMNVISYLKWFNVICENLKFKTFFSALSKMTQHILGQKNF